MTVPTGNVAAVAIGALAYTQFADSPEPLALILREIGQPWAARVLGASAVIALPTVILAFFYGQSRIFFVMARDGLLPSNLEALLSRYAVGDTVQVRCSGKGCKTKRKSFKVTKTESGCPSV